MYFGKIPILLFTMLMVCTLPAFAQDIDSHIIQYLNTPDNPDAVAHALIPYLFDSDPDVRLSALTGIILTESKLPEVLQAEQKLLYSEPPGEFRDLLELGIEVSGGTTYTGTPTQGAKTPLIIGSASRGSTVKSSRTIGYTSTGSTYTGYTSSQGSYNPEGKISGGCYTDPLTGEITCVDSQGEPTSTQEGVPVGCYRDPYTGQITCIDSYGEPTDAEEGSQGGAPSGSQPGPQGGCYEDPATGNFVCVD